MSLSLELSIKFGLPVSKAVQILEYLKIEDVGEFDSDKEFERVCRLINRKRSGAAALAFLSNASDEQRQFVFDIDADVEREYDDMGFPLMSFEYLADAKRIIDACYSSDRTTAKIEWSLFIAWVKAQIEAAEREISHNYLAVRLLLSLPEKDRAAYPPTIASLLNKARHREYLADWFRVDEMPDGKRKTVYFAPGSSAAKRDEIKTKVDTTWLSADIIALAIRALGTDDVSRIAGYLAFQHKRDASETLSIQAEIEKIINAKKSFDL